MEENKVTIAKDEFIELIADEIIEIGKDNLGVILGGGIITDIFCKKLFTDDESVSITKREYSELTAEAIHDFIHDKNNESVATITSLLAIVVAGEIKCKLFKEEV